MKVYESQKIITIPNILTLFRIIGAICLLFIKPFSAVFYVIFILCGLSDAADGPIARATNTSSNFGAKLDSAADLSFYSAMLIRILPFLWKNLPRWIFILAGIIFILRVTIYVYVGVRYHRFASIHTYANKISSASLFVIPLVAPTPLLVICSLIVTIFGILATSEELLIHCLSKSYRTDIKTIFDYRKKANS